MGRKVWGIVQRDAVFDSQVRLEHQRLAFGKAAVEISHLVEGYPATVGSGGTCMQLVNTTVGGIGAQGVLKSVDSGSGTRWMVAGRWLYALGG